LKAPVGDLLPIRIWDGEIVTAFLEEVNTSTKN